MRDRESQADSEEQDSMPKRGPSRIGSKEKRTRWQKKEAKDGQTPAAHAEQARSRKATRRARGSLRAGLAVVGGRTVGALSRRLHLGGGTSIVGIVAQRLYP